MSRSRSEIRPTVPADLPHVIDEPLPHRIQAVTILVDGRVVGLGGLGFKPDGTIAAFAALLDEARRHPVTLHRAGLMVMDMIEASGLKRVVATAEMTQPRAAAWLVRLGFEPRDVNGMQVFVWERPTDAAE